MRLLRPLERIGPDDIAVALMGALRAAYRFFGFARSALAMRPPEPQAMRQPADVMHAAMALRVHAPAPAFGQQHAQQQRCADEQCNAGKDKFDHGAQR